MHWLNLFAKFSITERMGGLEDRVSQNTRLARRAL